MTKNIALLKTTLDFIQANPDKHDQADWVEVNRCGTTMCFAGHAAALSGAEVPKDNKAWRLNPDGSLVERDENGRRTGGILIEDYARELLGMNYDEASFIFYCTENEEIPNRINYLIDLWERGEEYDGYSYYDDDSESCDCC